jgi:orotidine-5'-phosphate decarboxylase
LDYYTTLCKLKAENRKNLEMKQLKPEERLIVAADFKPCSDISHHTRPGSARERVRSHVLGLAMKLKGTGVYFKTNSDLRATGYDQIDAIHSLGLRVFADLKLDDTPDTLAIDGLLLQETKVEMLTVKCSATQVGMNALKAMLPHTEVLGVTVLTSITDADCLRLYDCKVSELAKIFAWEVESAGIDGVICSPIEAKAMREILGPNMTINTPNIRPEGIVVANDRQNPDRKATVKEAFALGADRIVIGRPIVQATDPLEAVKRILDEIASATS